MCMCACVQSMAKRTSSLIAATFLFPVSVSMCVLLSPFFFGIHIHVSLICFLFLLLFLDSIAHTHEKIRLHGSCCASSSFTFRLTSHQSHMFSPCSTCTPHLCRKVSEKNILIRLILWYTQAHKINGSNSLSLTHTTSETLHLQQLH